ncbi:D-beta-hydroxybutyrate dehydrogenase, mitochondrial [Gryllus bimaculatus]|nr:D-beta-hydroxybutyrate dehydrogenase, mitochondrial [Gryllus bimaculatus]
MRVPYLHEAYRAFTIGLQAGVVAVALLWLLRVTGLYTCACACPCATFVTACALGALAALQAGAQRLSATGRGVLVTGCDSGFGLALARRLQELGCVVFAGCLQAANGDGAVELRRLPRVHVLQLDVTNDEEIEAARAYVQQHLPVNGLWGVVNNAGIFMFGPAELTRPEDAARLFHVNTLGTLRVSKAFLPLLRRTKGRLVNMVSVAGREYCGPMASYTMSKHASEGLSDSLRLEQRRFGVHVATMTPGAFAAEKGRFFKLYAKDLSPVIAAIEHALFGKWPAPRYHPSDIWYLLRTVLNTHGPEWLYEKLYS